MKGLVGIQRGGLDDDCDYKLLRTWEHDGLLTVAMFSDGTKVVSGGWDGSTLIIWDTNTGKILHNL